MTLQFDPRTFFATPENFVMLNYQMKPDGFISLHATKFDVADEIPPYDSWFTDYDTSHIPREGNNHHGFCARSFMNQMAAKNRRGPANILFVPNADEYDRYSNMNGMLNQDRNGGWLERIVVDYRLQPNELRAAFWSRRYDRCVDGGVQFTPDGFVMQPLYKGFFGRTFL